jgi:glucose-6-phosphate-specific signal transduction histidine kinase
MSDLNSLKKTLSQSFVDNHENVSEDVAGELIVKAEQKIKAIKEERAADEKLAQAKQITKDLNSAYTAAIKYENAKIAFLLEKIEEIQNDEVNPTSSLKS